MVVNVSILTIFNIIVLCLGIEEDYYHLDVNDLNKQFNEYSNASLSRRIIRYNNEKDPQFSDLNSNMFFYYDKHKRKSYQKDHLNDLAKSVNTNNNIYSLKHTVAPSRKTYKPLSLTDLLQDYEYIFSENNQDQRSFSDDYALTNPQRTRPEKNSNETKTPLAVFYNLEPAVQRKINRINTTHSRYRSWYVLHDIPCWGLPPLYAQISLQQQEMVFSLYGKTLTNVEDPGWQDDSQKKVPGELETSESLNKWCEIEPCYGDHTLCVFRIKRIAKICPRDYKVRVPSITHQLTIVNTINSMRNRVATGLSKRYPHLPQAANMQQMIYDYDLEKISATWLRQCLPGPAPCSAINDKPVSELECMKHAKHCCPKSSGQIRKCVPRDECFLFAVTGCIHVWFSRAGKNLIKTDIQCGRTSEDTFDTVQLLWAKTTKVGCAYGKYPNGDIRVICNFSPGAPFVLNTKLYCGIISLDNLRQFDRQNFNITEEKFMSLMGLKWDRLLTHRNDKNNSFTTPSSQVQNPKKFVREISVLKKIYGTSWTRKKLNIWENGTRSWIARLVAKYDFIDKSESRCDADESIYTIGKAGSKCVENGRTFYSLCYEFRDPTPGYRLIAVIAPIVLFSLILYDLFSGVVRQTN